MGYGTRMSQSGHCINTFEPDNDANTLYLRSDIYSLEEMIEKAKEHFGAEVLLSDLTIAGENIHTDCLDYDLYDPSDYTVYIVIRRSA